MNVQVENKSSTPTDLAYPVPLPVLDGLASRFRAGGLFLMALMPDGTPAWHDPAAPTFFLKYVVPYLQSSELDPKSDFLARAARDPTSVAIHRVGPGLLLACVPHIEKRQTRGMLIVVARDESFQLDEDVLRLCSRLSLDSIWLHQQARELPSYNEISLQRQARLVLACLRDQLRLFGLETELQSISEQLASTYEELSLIYQVSSGMKVNRSASDFFQQTCQDVLQVVGTRGMGVAIHPDSCRPGDPVLYGQLSLPAHIVKQLGEELVEVVSRRKTPLLINTLATDKQFVWLSEHAHQLLAVPLLRYDKTLGCLFALDKETGEFDSADAKLLNSIANESAIYLENAKLFDDAHGLMMGLLHSLTSAVDAKDAYTCGHSERVALLSRHLAQEIGLSEADVEQIYMAGLLHDVGKIGVPESVLQKTGKLTAEEFEQMKKHPQIGAKILQDVKQIKKIIPGVLHHHERYDGTGYPTGLSGSAIPLMGRIICLADSFDAMTSNRTYRSALPIEVALAEIRRCAGVHFDPELAVAFVRTSADRYYELLQDHQKKSKKLLDT